MAEITVDDVNAEIEKYRDAMIAKSYAAARDALLTYAGMLVGFPNVTGQDGALVHWRTVDIDKMLDRLDKLELAKKLKGGGKSPFQLIGIRPKRAGD